MSSKNDDEPPQMGKLFENANRILEGKNWLVKLPPERFHDCCGLIFLTGYEVGLFFSGAFSSGILLGHKDGQWSPPYAIQLTSYGFGMTAGGEFKDLIIFLRFPGMLKTFSADNGLQFGVQYGGALGPIGSEGTADITLSSDGHAPSAVYAHPTGAQLSAHIHFSYIKPKHAVNREFYGQETSPGDIFQNASLLKYPQSEEGTKLYNKLEELEAEGIENLKKQKERKPMGAGIGAAIGKQLDAMEEKGRDKMGTN